MGEGRALATAKCENCGKFFDYDSKDGAPMYCPKCEDWLEWKREEDAQRKDQ